MAGSREGGVCAWTLSPRFAPECGQGTSSRASTASSASSAQGGMGVVVAAHHLQLDERVALKFLSPEAPSKPEAVARFRREARAAVEDQERARRARDRRRAARERRAVHRHGVPRRRSTSPAWLEQRGRAAGRAGGRLRAPGLRGDRRGARARHRSPRPQAGEPLLHPSAPDGSSVVKVLDFGISKIDHAGRVAASAT